MSPDDNPATGSSLAGHGRSGSCVLEGRRVSLVRLNQRLPAGLDGGGARVDLFVETVDLLVLRPTGPGGTRPLFW